MWSMEYCTGLSVWGLEVSAHLVVGEVSVAAVRGEGLRWWGLCVFVIESLFSVWLSLILGMHKTNGQVSTCQSFAHGFSSVIPSSGKRHIFEVLKWRCKDLIWPGTSFRGMQWQSWLWYCASRKVAGPIPDGVTGIFHRYNPSGCTMALGSIQPLTEMSKR